MNENCNYNKIFPLTAEYTIERNELKHGLNLDNKKNKIFLKQIIVSLIFFAIFIFGLVKVISSPYTIWGYIIFLFTVAGFLYSFLYQRINDNKYINKLINNWCSFEIIISTHSIILSDPQKTKNNTRVYDLKFDGNLKIYECETLFTFIFKEKTVFILPKRAFNLEEIVHIHNLFKDKSKDLFYEF